MGKFSGKKIEGRSSTRPRKNNHNRIRMKQEKTEKYQKRKCETKEARGNCSKKKNNTKKPETFTSIGPGRGAKMLVETQNPGNILWLSRPFSLQVYKTFQRAPKKLHLFQAHGLIRVFDIKDLSRLRNVLLRNNSWWELLRDGARCPLPREVRRLSKSKKKSARFVRYIRGRIRLVSFSELTMKGFRVYVRYGFWMEQGHACFGGKAHPVKSPGYLKGGFMPKEFMEAIRPIAEAAAEILRKYRKDLCDIIDECNDPDTFCFGGYFHLFMAAKGMTKYHLDKTNALAFLFPLSLLGRSRNKMMGGGFEICVAEKQNVGFCWRVGDCCFADTRNLGHGTGKYLGGIGDRMLGMFIIQSSIFSKYNKNKEVLALREKTYEYFNEHTKKVHWEEK